MTNHQQNLKYHAIKIWCSNKKTTASGINYQIEPTDHNSKVIGAVRFTLSYMIYEFTLRLPLAELNGSLLQTNGYFAKILRNIITILFNLQTQQSKSLLSDRFFVFI